MNNTQIDYKALFQMFVSDDELRPQICRPFKKNGSYYATDSCSMIILPVEKADIDFQEYSDSISVGKVIPKENTCEIKINIADLDRQLIPDFIDETVTIGKDIKCEDCNGDGHVEWEYSANGGRTHYMKENCPVCSGCGYLEETSTKPTGRRIPDPTKRFKMLDAYFLDKQIRRFLEACKMIGAETVTKTSGTEKSANIFQVADFIIIVMPCYVDEDKIENPITDIILE